ncbi:MAG TPA: type VI secretion system baseplate subunit TssG [Polyangium sp.]|uniref:Type VI secretion system baseplate subunit TssG n=1 Tax=Polyangium mundeleinium TaxID=2995306 RepID=A0ABT5EWW8_9BACT|nr:type VI secretion system baseplate subunit TssG [Polyangium mundeleinium]MDC0746314.1 type VI secretion system baseplate subunit TssG [Polyangium mundeleinium]HVK71626.1 type VI secretion system baseplate subunit TssG [Polyangium sp.]
MGAEERQPQPDLSGGPNPDAAFAPSLDPERQAKAMISAKMAELEHSARRYSFFRLVYILERLFPGSAPVGQLGPVATERIRLRGDTSLIFASTDVSELKSTKYPDEIDRARITAGFMGLYGSVSPLPTYYVEELAQDDYQGGPQPKREFLDVFNHRLLSLFYRAFTKYRHSVGYRKKGDDPFTRRLLCAAGVDGFREHKSPLHRFLYLRYAPLLATKSRSAHGLEVVLKDIFGSMGVDIEQFVGHWTLIEKPLRNKMGVANHQLGESLTIGRWVYDGTGRFKIKLGPLKYDEYISFLPGGSNRSVLKAAVDTLTRGACDAMLELHVATEDAPRFQLASPRASTLSRTTWLGGPVGQNFVIEVPLNDKPQRTGQGDEEEEERLDPPPLPY